MKKLLLLLCLIAGLSFQIHAQTKTIHGYVYSEEDNEPLVGATIMPQGVSNARGAATDINGKFSLQIPSNVKSIKVSYVGMRTVTVNVSTGEMRIGMVSDDNRLDEVMVVAYGTAKKGAYTGSASVVKADQIENTLVTDVVSALNGTVSGVQMTSNNGAPGASPTIRIRGMGSLSSGNNPLYVVDGVPYDGDMTSLSPSDVESITVLKDAASSALYGARGANGVILITTKKGREGKANITINANWGANSRQVGAYETVGGADSYYMLMYRALRNRYQYLENKSAIEAHNTANNLVSAPPGSGNIFGYQIFTVPEGQSLIGIDGSFNPNASLGYLYTNSNGSYWLTPDNWQQETFVNGLRQEYNVAVSGGGDKYDFMVSFNYLNDEGTVRESSFDRITTRLNSSYQLMKWMRLGANMSYSHESYNYPLYQTASASSSDAAANAFYLANMVAPIYPYYIRNGQGEIQYSKTGYPEYDFGSTLIAGYGLPRAYWTTGNPTGTLVYDRNVYAYNSFDGKWYLRLTPIDGLTVTGTISYWLRQYADHDTTSPVYGWGSTYGGSVNYSGSLNYSINYQALANYVKSWGNNNFDFLIGYEAYKLNMESNSAGALNAFNPGNYTLSNVIDDKFIGGGINQYATMGYFARVNYDFDNRYFAMASYRRDASSRFAPDKRWGNFFSVSAGWNIAHEKFMEDFENVDMLKLKVSFGQQGNDNIGNYYAYIDQYSMSGADGVWTTSSLSYKGNPDLTWETSNAFNAGIDFSFFQGRIEGSLEYFSRITSNMLYNRPVQSSLGYGSIPMNIGSIENNGIEAELRLTPIRTRDWDWNINLNMTYWHNRVRELAPELEGRWLNGSYLVEVGKSLYQFWTVKYAGVEQDPNSPNAGLPLYWAKNAAGEEYRTPDYNTAQTTNQTSVGNVLPPVYGGFGTTLRWKGIDASIQFAYQLGGRIYDYGYLELMHGGNYAGEAMHIDALNAWSPTNTNTDIPMLLYNYEYTIEASDRWLTNASYLAINNVNIGYNFPRKLLSKIKVQDLRIYASADNVQLWSHRKGLDPRQSLFTSAAGNYSTIRSISGGIKIVF